MPRITPLILAAGASRRLGQCKALLRYDGQTLLEHLLNKLAVAGFTPPVIVTGAWHDEIAAAHPEQAFHQNMNWHKGIGHSIAFGVDRVSTLSDGVMITLVDQVAITASSFKLLRKRWESEPAIAAAGYGGIVGVPAIFSREYFHQLSALDGDVGARHIIQHARDVSVVPLAEGSIDIDTPQDWQSWLINREKRTA